MEVSYYAYIIHAGFCDAVLPCSGRLFVAADRV